MRRFALALLFCAACCADPEAGDGIRLPTVGATGLFNPGRGVVKVTRDGRIFHAGKQHTVNELIKTAREPSLPRPFELRADRDAIWMHVQWVMAALGEAGHTDVLLVVNSEGGEGAVRYAPLRRGYFWDRFLLNPLDNPEQLPVHLSVVTVLAGPPVAYRLGWEDKAPTTRDSAAVGKWAASFLATANEERNVVVFLALDAESLAPYQAVIAGLVQLQRGGARGVEVAMQALHPWDRDRRVLPPPPRGNPLVGWFVTDLSAKSIVPVNLPVASMAAQDKGDDPDDRIIVNLTATGRVNWKDKDLSLDELSVVLKRMVERYNIKMKRRGKSGYEEVPDRGRWSKLYVLLWADQDASWQHVRWILAELARSRLYKIQFGARKFPSADWTQAELDHREAGREIFGFMFLDAKLSCFQPTLPSGVDPRASYVDVHVVGTPARYKEAENAEALVTRIRDDYRLRGDRMAGRIHAEPGTPLGKVVEAVNCFAQVGIAKVDLEGVEPAPDEMRVKKRLPE